MKNASIDLQIVFAFWVYYKLCNIVKNCYTFQNQTLHGRIGTETIFGYVSLVLVYFYDNPMQRFFAILEKRVLDPNGPYINMFQTNVRNFNLSVILSIVCHRRRRLYPRSSLHQLMQRVEIFTTSQVYGSLASVWQHISLSNIQRMYSIQ